MQKELKITFEEYASIDQLPLEAERNLCYQAIEASKTAYAPYSNFHVGAALLLDNGIVVKGSNQENAAYPSGLCAERTAMFAAHSTYPEAQMVSIAVVAMQNGEIEEEPATPCGSCRQVMAEFQRPEKTSILLIGRNRIVRYPMVECLLPFIFSNL